MTGVSSLAPDRRGPRWLLPALWVGLTIALAIAVRALPWQTTLEQLRRISWAWLGVAILAYELPLVIWAREWQLLTPGARVVPYGRMFDVVSTMAAVLNSVPFFAGEASGIAMLIERAGLSRGAALSVLAVDQLLGGLVKLVVLAAAAALVPLPSWLRAGVFALLGGVAALLVLFVPLAYRWQRLHRWLASQSSRLGQLLARVAAWGRHLDALRETGRIWRVSILALAKRLVELVAILSVQMAFGLDPSLTAAVLVLAALAIATMVPVAPANIGIYEAVVFATYRYLGLSTETALGLAVIQHLCYLVPMLATGYLRLTLRQLSPRTRR